jgi:hypothetical protein
VTTPETHLEIALAAKLNVLIEGIGDHKMSSDSARDLAFEIVEDFKGLFVQTLEEAVSRIDRVEFEARLNALQREVAYSLGSLWAATPALTAIRGPQDHMDRLMGVFKEADRQAVEGLKAQGEHRHQVGVLDMRTNTTGPIGGLGW